MIAGDLMLSNAGSHRRLHALTGLLRGPREMPNRTKLAGFMRANFVQKAATVAHAIFQVHALRGGPASIVSHIEKFSIRESGNLRGFFLRVEEGKVC